MTRDAEEQDKAGKRNGRKEKKPRKLSNLEAAAFAGQMALVLQAGIPAVEGISLMYEGAQRKDEKVLLKQILDDARGTGVLAPALEKTGVFPQYMLRMITIGERTGNLDTVMVSLEEFYENEEQHRKEASDAVLYPLILACVMVAVVIVLMVQVMPVFDQVYQELGMEMTGLPLALKNVGDGIRTYTLSVLLGVGSVVLIVFVSRLTEEGRTFWHNFGRHFGPIRSEYEAEDAGHFAGVMSMTLASGLTPEEGMDMAAELISEPSFREKMEAVRQDMAAGIPMAESLKNHAVFTGSYAGMMLLGEKAGSLDSVLDEIAGLYREEVQDRLNRFIYAVEPTLVIILSALTGVILLSAMLPLLGIMSSL